MRTGCKHLYDLFDHAEVKDLVPAEIFSLSKWERYETGATRLENSLEFLHRQHKAAFVFFSVGRIARIEHRVVQTDMLNR